MRDGTLVGEPVAPMPTVARHGPYRVFFFSNEGFEPRHVHIQHGRALAKFWLEPVRLATAAGFNARELRELNKLVEVHQAAWLEAWHEYFER